MNVCLYRDADFMRREQNSSQVSVYHNFRVAVVFFYA